MFEGGGDLLKHRVREVPHYQSLSKEKALCGDKSSGAFSVGLDTLEEQCIMLGRSDCR